MNRNLYRIAGALVWAMIFMGAYMVSTKTSEVSGRVSLVRYLSGPTETLDALDPAANLREYDPVFSLEPDRQGAGGGWKQIGYVESVAGNGMVKISWYSSTLSPTNCRLVQYRNSGRLEDIVATMLPPEKRLRIQQRLATAISTHGDALSASFVPLVQASLQRSLPIIEEELRKSADRHRPEIDRLADRWNDQVVRERLIPLARQEILPIIRNHGEPTAEVIGRELWDRASLWRFGWRAIYDKSPLPRKDLLQEEWDRFVDEEAISIFESHMDEVVVAVQNIVIDVTTNQAIRTELGTVASDIASDPESQQLVRLILKEALIDNERLKEAWSRVWSSQEAHAALDMAGDRLEPVVRSIGEELFGTREGGITPNFARVLRNQILGKDRRWIVAYESDASAEVLASPPVIKLSQDSMLYPIVYTVGESEDPLGE